MTRSNSKRIGDIEVVPLSDGILNATLKNFVGIEHEECARISGWPIEGPVPLAVNAFLLKFGGKHALIDAGCSDTMGPTLGKLPDNLRAAGVAPEQIDCVLLTHIHPDHSNGLVDAAGDARYPNAEIIVSGEDAAYFLERDPAEESNEFRQRGMRAAQRAMLPYRDRMRRIAGGEIFTGVSAHPQPGHTLGHTGWLISSRNDAVLIWGDIVHVSGVQFERPDAALTFDLDPDMARKSRQRVFDWVATDKIRVAGAHMDLPSFGYVSRRGAGYAFTPET
jgi:glyoxylase-like metal-dependent hydrolase (beta-lactamase superfamily II)